MTELDELRLLQRLTGAMAEAPDVAAAARQLVETICSWTGWAGGEAWLGASSAALRREVGWSTVGGMEVVVEDGAQRVLAACERREAVWSDDHTVAIPVLADQTAVAGLIFWVRGAGKVEQRAVELVTVVSAQLGQWLLRKRAEDAVRLSEERLRLLIENVGDAVVLLDVAGNIHAWSPAAERILGHSAAKVLTLPAGQFTLPEDGPEDAAAALAAAGVSGRHQATGWCPRSDGTRVWIQAVTCPVRDSGGAVTGYARVLRDLTPMRLAEQAMKDRAQLLERSNRELEEFASIASHDLQEPLRKIRSFGDRLRTRCAGALDEKGLDYLGRVDHAAARMQQLVDDLLTYSRLAARNQPLQPVDLDKVLREVLRDLESAIEHKQARVDAEPLPTLEADPTQMRQLLQNLIANALKFQRSGTIPVVRVFAEAALEKSDGRTAAWRLVVQDNGIGFDQKYAGRIFGMLQRLHGRSEYEGTGMGLAICRRIVERHGGEIVALGVPDEGARFVVTLPERQAGGQFA